MSFSDDVRRFSVKANQSADTTVRAVTLSLFKGIINDTPVDTGRARGNWQTTVDSPASGQTERVGAGLAIAEVEANTPDGAGQVTYMANDLPYILSLEEGNSKQAPQGMVRRNMDRIQANLAREARKNKV